MDILRFINSKRIKKYHDERAGHGFAPVKACSPEPEHIKIWLDDIREAPDGYFHCRSVNEAVRRIVKCEEEHTVIDVIDCDHDLGDYAGDGGDGIKLIDWLAERETYYPVALHTMNPVGRENMQREIERYWK